MRCASPTPSVEDVRALRRASSLSRLSSPLRSRVPERFQGGCSFGGGVCAITHGPLSSAEGRMYGHPGQRLHGGPGRWGDRGEVQAPSQRGEMGKSGGLGA